MRKLRHDERPPSLLWFFAGRPGPPRTGKQLKARKKGSEVKRKRGLLGLLCCGCDFGVQSENDSDRKKSADEAPVGKKNEEGEQAPSASPAEREVVPKDEGVVVNDAEGAVVVEGAVVAESAAVAENAAAVGGAAVAEGTAVTEGAASAA